VISVVGDLDLATADAFEQEIATVLGADVSGVVVDLSGVDFLDSAGINALVTSRRLADESGRTFRVDRAGGFVREVLELTGVWSHLSEPSP
jgi:anti-sigma B factor antagonist